MNKDFWRCWINKICNKCPRFHNVGGFFTDADISNVFADHFSVVVIIVPFHRTALF